MKILVMGGAGFVGLHVAEYEYLSGKLKEYDGIR